MTTTTLLATASRDALRSAWRREPTLIVASAFMLLIVALVIIWPAFLPDLQTTNPGNRLKPPSDEHLLGTDGLGRDVLSRLVNGGRGSLGLVACVMLTATALGTLVGLISGYYQKVGNWIMRLMDAWLAFPALILAMVLAISFGASFWTEWVALTIIFTPATSRVIRSRVLAISQRSFVEAARVSGVSSFKVLFTHVFPNVIPLALVQTVIIGAASMLADGALSFLGLGIAPPTPTWGNMINEGQQFLRQDPMLIVYPGLAIALCVLLLNLIGNSLRPFVDPRYRMVRELERSAAQRRRGARRG